MSLIPVNILTANRCPPKYFGPNSVALTILSTSTANSLVAFPITSFQPSPTHSLPRLGLYGIKGRKGIGRIDGEMALRCGAIDPVLD